MVNTWAGNVAIVEAARSIIAQATAEPLPPAQPVLMIRSEADAREAFGSARGLGAFFGQPASPLVIYELPGGGGVLPPMSTVTVDGLNWPAPAAAGRWCWRCLEVSHDPQRSPPVSCRVDGVMVELERHLDGIWRPRRAESDG